MVVKETPLEKSHCLSKSVIPSSRIGPVLIVQNWNLKKHVEQHTSKIPTRNMKQKHIYFHHFYSIWLFTWASAVWSSGAISTEICKGPPSDFHEQPSVTSDLPNNNLPMGENRSVRGFEVEKRNKKLATWQLEDIFIVRKALGKGKYSRHNLLCWFKLKWLGLVCRHRCIQSKLPTARHGNDTFLPLPKSSTNWGLQLNLVL